MLIELLAIQHVLKRWLQTPDAPICEISLRYGEKRNCPYTIAEIQKMRDFLKRHAFTTYIRLFYWDGPRRS
jgi:predicted metal-binding protein